LLAGACGAGGGSAAPGQVKVVATTTQLGDFARAVGGERAKVVQVLKPNTDPHDYEPRPSDVRETANADVVLLNGDELDRWMGDVVEAAGGDPRVVDLGARVPVKVAGESDGPEASRYDPHWWHDPRNAQAAVTAIRDALTKANPDARDVYARNAADYLARLRSLDRGIAGCMRGVAPAERKLVTDHDAFNYFARRYAITVVGAVIPSQSTQAQPSAGDVARLTRLIRRERVKAVFPESSINAKLSQAIARQTGATSDHELYGDTLGPKGSGGATYLTMERANADAMVRGFTAGARGCPIPGI
jgi:zinc/manganese transport system substrate-binding protein